MSKNQELFNAAANGDYDSVAKLLKEGADIEHQERPNTTPLKIAAQEGHTEVVRLLLENGANIYFEPFNQKSDEPSYDFAKNIDIKLMLYNQNSKIYEFLKLVKNEFNYKKLRKLLSENTWLSNVKYLNNFSPLIEAAKFGNISIVKLLLSYDADPNSTSIDGTTALITAAENNDKNLVELLLSHGANPNSTSIDGTTALITAAENSNKSLVELLLSHGANPNLQNENGCSALMFSSPEIAELLLEYGANPDILDNSLSTVLKAAIEAGNSMVAETLLNYGANTDLRNTEGNTVLEDIIHNIKEIEKHTMKYLKAKKTPMTSSEIASEIKLSLDIAINNSIVKLLIIAAAKDITTLNIPTYLLPSPQELFMSRQALLKNINNILCKKVEDLGLSITLKDIKDIELDKYVTKRDLYLDKNLSDLLDLIKDFAMILRRVRNILVIKNTLSNSINYAVEKVQKSYDDTLSPIKQDLLNSAYEFLKSLFVFKPISEDYQEFKTDKMKQISKILDLEAREKNILYSPRSCEYNALMKIVESELNKWVEIHKYKKMKQKTQLKKSVQSKKLTVDPLKTIKRTSPLDIKDGQSTELNADRIKRFHGKHY